MFLDRACIGLPFNNSCNNVNIVSIATASMTGIHTKSLCINIITPVTKPTGGNEEESLKSHSLAKLRDFRHTS